MYKYIIVCLKFAMIRECETYDEAATAIKEFMDMSANHNDIRVYYHKRDGIKEIQASIVYDEIE